MTEMVRNQSEIFLVMAGCGLAAGLVQSVFRSFAEIKKLKTFGQAASELCCWIVIGFMISEFFYYCDNGKITFSGIIWFLSGLLLWKRFFCDILIMTGGRNGKEKGTNK